MEKGILALVLLCYLPVHFRQVLLGLLNKSRYFGLKIVTALMRLNLSDALLELGVLLPELLCSATHLNCIQTKVIKFN